MVLVLNQRDLLQIAGLQWARAQSLEKQFYSKMVQYKYLNNLLYVYNAFAAISTNCNLYLLDGAVAM